MSKDYRTLLAALCLLANVTWLGCGSKPGTTPVSSPTSLPQPAPIPTPAPATPSEVTISQSRPMIDPRAQRLRDAYNAWSHDWNNTSLLQRGLAALRDELHELTVTTGDQPLHWNSVTLARLPALGGGGADRLFDAFRFRSPFELPADLHWVFAVPESVGRWYILPLKGEMQGFESFERMWNLKPRDVPTLPGSTFVFQELLGGRILPGEEYILWYKPPDGAPSEFHAALRLTPAGMHTGAASAEEIARALQLDLQEHDFPQTPEGLQSAFDVAAKVVSHSGSQPQAAASVLRAVAPMLQEIHVATQDGPPVWNQVTPDSLRFCAVRFRSPLDQTADMHWCHVVRHDQLRFGVAPVEGALKPPEDYRLEVDCPIPGTANPQENLAVLQTISEGQILPGKEYILWFAPHRGLLPDFDVALRLSPAGTFSESTNARSIAEALGVDVPETPTPERVNAALHRCRLLADDRRTDSWEFQRLIQWVQPYLPTLGSSEGPTKWVTVDLNRDGRDFAAFRVHAELGSVVRVIAAVARPPTRQLNLGFVYFYPQIEWNGIRSTGRKTQASVTAPGLPLENIVDVEHISDWQVKPGESLVLAISPVDSDPVTVQTALAVRPSIGRVGLTNVSAALEVMGLGSTSADTAANLDADRGPFVSAIRFINDSLLAVGCSDGTIELREAASGKTVGQRHLGRMDVRAIALSRDQSRMAVVVAVPYENPEIVVCDPITLEEQARHRMPNGRSIRYVDLSPDGHLMIAGEGGEEYSRTSALCIWNLEQGGQPRFQEFPKGTVVRAALWLPDGKTIVTAGNQTSVGQVSFRNGETFNVQAEFTEGNAQWQTLTLSADGSRLAASSRQGLITIWNSNARMPIGSFAQEAPDSLAISSDGSRLTTLGRDGMRIWDVNTRRALSQSPSESTNVTAIAFSPNGATIALGGVDREVKFRPMDAPQSSPTLAGEVQANTLGQKLVPIPAGEFVMGTTDETDRRPTSNLGGPNERPAHSVRITKGFYMSATEVTVAQFRAFVDATGYRTTAESSGKGGEHLFAWNEKPRSDPKLNWKNPGFSQADDHPVVHVSWHDAVAFCDWLSKKEGVKHRLPTEAEWEYACRAGTSTNWYCGDFANHLQRAANFADKELVTAYQADRSMFSISDGSAYTSPVGSYIPNAFGLFDMHGNVWEWCSDWYDPVYYNYSPSDDPTGPKNGKTRVQRGGGFWHSGVFSRSAYRDHGPPDQVMSCLGFRVVREVP